MLLALITGVALQASEAPTRLTPPLQFRCRNGLSQAAGSLTAPRSRKLGELPPGQAMLAVNKSVDGCPVAVLVRRDSSGERVNVPMGPASAVRLPAGRR